MLAACAHRAPPPPQACTEELETRGVAFEKLPDFHNGNGCGIEDNVRVERSPIPLSRETLMNCSFAVALADFEIKIVRPAAKRYLHKPVAQIVHAGTYACRDQRGGDTSRLSQHAYGKAIDVLGFELEDGERVSVLKDWRGDSAKAKFLHAVAKGACTIFDVVITPNHNRFHLDHIHMDKGPYKLCGI
jgi:hypothetical protein